MSDASHIVDFVDMSAPLPPVDPSDVAFFQQVQQVWNQGDPQQASAMVRARAEADHPWAAALLAWMLTQQGYPSLDEAVTWALRAAESGFAGQLTQTYNNVVGNLSSYPQLANHLSELLTYGAPWWPGPDFIGQAWNLMASGQPELATRLLMTPSPPPPWTANEQLTHIVTSAGNRLRGLEDIAAAIQNVELGVQEASARAQEVIDRTVNDLETKAGQAGLLVNATTSDATNSLFKADAARNAKESRGSWVGGLVTLGAAATVAVLPVFLHYLQIGPDYTAFEQVGLHLVSTAALATFAGVLLARARSRDQSAQRAHDLSTAMGTMIAYSNQISDPSEKQRFMTTMGQLVLQAHLTTGGKAGTGDESLSGMLALAHLIKPSATSAASSAS